MTAPDRPGDRDQARSLSQQRRLAVQEGDRDQQQAGELTGADVEAAYELLREAPSLRAREKAKRIAAALAAARADGERLRERIEALADEWSSIAAASREGAEYDHGDWMETAADRLRAALGGDS